MSINNDSLALSLFKKGNLDLNKFDKNDINLLLKAGLNELNRITLEKEHLQEKLQSISSCIKSTRYTKGYLENDDLNKILELCDIQEKSL